MTLVSFPWSPVFAAHECKCPARELLTRSGSNLWLLSTEVTDSK